VSAKPEVRGAGVQSLPHGHDTLSDLLRSVRLRSAVFYYVSCDGTWAAEAPRSREIAAAVMPDVEHVMEYHVLTSGECWVGLIGQPPVKMQRGDIALLAQGDAHVLSSAPGMRTDPDVEGYFKLGRAQRPFRIHYGNGGAASAIVDYDGAMPPLGDSAGAASFVCGFIGCDLKPFNPLMATLPRLLHLPAAGGALSEQFASFAAAVSAERRPGSEALLERLSEMMFVDAIRRHVEHLPADTTGWLAGLRDRYVGRALALLHERPSAPWTIEDLSSQVGLSRSALHERFVSLIGQPPVQYLTNWRMQLASRLLLEGRSTVAAVAVDVGYDSEAAFARAFKRLVGMPPAAWRRSHELAAAPAR
jgi:AraC-like DNA-binding protein